MAKPETPKQPQHIILRDLPADIWELICEQKRKILQRNRLRGSVSHAEAIYKLMKGNAE